MKIYELAKEIAAYFEQIEPGVTAAVKIGAYFAVAKNSAGKILQKGKRLVTYLFAGKTENATLSVDANAKASGLVPVSLEVPIVEKDEVAILVDITKRSLKDVAAYLDRQKIDANLIVITNDPAYSSQVNFLDPLNAAEWEELLSDFSVAMNAIQHAVGAVRLHIFIAAPVALAFGLGCMWGTVSKANVYHWDGDTYQLITHISRKLKNPSNS